MREGVRRLADYQDLEYAEAYLDRLRAIRELDMGGDEGAYRLTNETARHLALWMSYEDTIRVADLKTRSQRFRDVRKEVRAEADQPVYIVEFLHPGVEEICDTLPAPLGRLILQTKSLRSVLDRALNPGRRVSTGKLAGFLALYAVAGLRRWRRLTYRYRREMDLIDGWLAKVTAAARANYELAVETARLQRLVKGYGDTHARGLKSLTAIMDAAVEIGSGPDAAAALRGLSDAALADEDGHALQEALKTVRSESETAVA